MKRCMDKAWAKLTAYFLALVMAAATAAGAVGIVVLAEYNVFLDGGAALTEQVYSAACRHYIYEADSYLTAQLKSAGVITDSDYYDTIETTDAAGQDADELLENLPERFSAAFDEVTTPCQLRVRLGDGDEWLVNFGVESEEEILYSTYVRRECTLAEGATEVYTIEGNLLDTAPAPNYELMLLWWLVRHVGLTVLLTVLSAALALFAVGFLLVSAGHWQGREGIHLTWFDRIPLDLLLLALVALDGMLYDGLYNELLPILVVTALYVPLLLSAFAAQCKAGTVLRGTLTARVCRLVWRMVKATGRGLRYMADGLPLVWKTVLICAALVALELLCLDGNGALYIILKALEVLSLVFVALNLRTLQQGGSKLAEGDYSQSIDTRYLVGDFKRHGQQMNDLRGGMERAVQEQTRAERMKTELITNVSHDIKTPLTSIVNYVDLLQKEDVQPEAAREYIAVLDRQSRRLKKLTEDLVEASKASSGTLPVDLQPTDVDVLFSQIVGEYEERLADCHLTLIARPPEKSLTILADSKLLSRVMDNLVSNVCKYALPETRVYVTAAENGGAVTLSFKNVSRAQLNISPDELMERFVRGDASRHTEGSGLGLSIAQSLVELQGGTFALSIDADLFRADVTFPLAETPDAPCAAAAQ